MSDNELEMAEDGERGAGGTTSRTAERVHVTVARGAGTGTGTGIGRALPLNSKQLTATLLRQMARGLGVPISAGIADIRTLITAKLEVMGKNQMNTQVIILEGEGVLVLVCEMQMGFSAY